MFSETAEISGATSMSTQKADTVPSKTIMHRFLSSRHLWIFNAVAAVFSFIVAAIVARNLPIQAAVNAFLGIVNIGFAVKIFSLRSQV